MNSRDVGSRKVPMPWALELPVASVQVASRKTNRTAKVANVFCTRLTVSSWRAFRFFSITVDGSEIRDQLKSHYLQGLIHSRWCRISEPSTVVFEFSLNSMAWSGAGRLLINYHMKILGPVKIILIFTTTTIPINLRIYKHIMIHCYHGLVYMYVMCKKCKILVLQKLLEHLRIKSFII